MCGPLPTETAQPTLFGRLLDILKQPQTTGRVEWATFTAGCVLVLFLHVTLYRHSGSFWRDEASTIRVATAPGWGANVEFAFDRLFPIAFCRPSAALDPCGPGTTEAGIRLFGLVISLGVVVSLACSGLALTGRAPLVAISLIAFNWSVFYFGSSIRAYGLAVLFIVPCFAAFWRVVRSPTRWNVAAALVLATLSIHCNYQNCYLLLAIGVAGACACREQALEARSSDPHVVRDRGSFDAHLPAHHQGIPRWRRDPRHQMGPKHDTRAARRGACRGEFSSPCHLDRTVARSRRVPGLPVHSRSGPAVRPENAVAGAVQPSGDRDRRYCRILFFRINRMFPYPWHFIPWIAFSGMVVEIGFRTLRSAVWSPMSGLLASGLVIALCTGPIWRLAHVRRTNLDVIAEKLTEEARPGDLILVSPFYLCPGFEHHYRGPVEWSQLPSPGRIKELMMTADAITPTLSKVRRTLSSGNRVWCVGGLRFLPPNKVPWSLPPAPHSQFGWDSNAYIEEWSMQTGYFVQNHALRRRILPVDRSVNELENVPLMCVEGWRGE